MIDAKTVKSLNRYGTNSTKWDGLKSVFGKDDILPMWVADMDYECPSSVKKALREIVERGIHGYYLPPDSYYEAFIDWQKEKNDFCIEKEWIRFSPGVVTSLYWFVNILTQPAESCIILTPCYYPFMDAVVDNDRKLITSVMKHDDQFRYAIDFQDFEKKIIENDVKLFILCSPHNPVGRCWNKEELEKLVEICKKYDVYIISDEIHSDLIMPGYKHTVTQTIAGTYNDHIVTTMAGSKTFNLAGCANSYLVIEDERLRKMFDEFIKRIRVIRGASLGYSAVEAAFKNGEEWLEKVIESIHSNYNYLKEQLEVRLPMANITPLEATYLTWIDIGEYVNPDEIEEVIINKCKIGVDFGSWFLSKERDIKDTHIRINIATSRENIEEAVKRLENLSK